MPEAILPAEVQKKVYEQCKDHPETESPPQCFVDELSQLPPYNYYMLYSLSAHLSIVNQQSEVNKMNLSNLGMIFCSTLRIDRFCFNWLVGHWADCWQGCWTERDELEKTDRELWKKQRDNASAIPSPAATFDTRSSAPSSPAPSSTAPHTPVPPSSVSHDTPSHSPTIVQLPPIASPHTTQSPLSIKTLNMAKITTSRAPSEKGSLGAHSAPPTPRTPVPPTPYTPASFVMGDDQRMMVHAASDIISDYAEASDEEEEPAVAHSKGKQKRRQITDEDLPISHGKTGLAAVQEDEAIAPPEKNVVVKVEPLKTEQKLDTPSQPVLKLDGLPLSVPPVSSFKGEKTKAAGDRPPNIRVPPLNTDMQKPAGLPGHLQLMLPPLTPMSPLIATIDHKSG